MLLMKGAVFVRVLDGERYGAEIPRGSPRRQRVAARQLRQIPPFDVVHRKVILTVMIAEFMDGDDVRMLQARGRFRLETKTADKLLAGKFAEQNHLHGDDAIEAELAGPVHDTHTAAGDFFE